MVIVRKLISAAENQGSSKPNKTVTELSGNMSFITMTMVANDNEINITKY